MARNSPNRLASALLAAALFGIGSGSLIAQGPASPKPSAAIPVSSSLPANQSTQRAEDPVVPASSEQKPSQRFQVDFAAGRVAVDASNASLNQVLRDVARKAGIKVTGSVSDERVFGHYGPSAPSVVLAALLDGTASNMLLVADAKGSSELILTPRRGSASPPSANPGPQQDANADEPEDNSPPQYAPPARNFQPPTVTGRGPVDANADGSPSTGAAQADESSDETPQTNGQKSPQQIYEQLQKMMQQRQSSGQTPPAQEPQDQ